MDLTQLADLGEFIGGIAVLVTLIYLAVQVREVRKGNVLAASDKHADLWFDVCNSVIDNFELFCRGVEGKDITEKEMVKFTFLMNEVFGFFETFRTKYEQGAISQKEWERQERVMQWYLAWPGMEEWWRRAKPAFSESFADSVTAIFSGFNNGTISRHDFTLSEEMMTSRHWGA